MKPCWRLRKVVSVLSVLLFVMALGVLRTSLREEGQTEYRRTHRRATSSQASRVMTTEGATRKFRTSPHLQYNFSLFQVNSELLEIIGLEHVQYISLNKTSVQQFVFVTAADASYRRIAMKSIATVQKYYPERKVIFYDLDLNPKENSFQDICQVEYRKFPFSKYPEHVSRRYTYAWKPLIVLEVLQEYPGIVWMDSSVRFLSDRLHEAFPKVLTTDGVLLFNYAGHNTFSVTHPKMLKYLALDTALLQSIFQYEANLFMVYRTRSVFDDIIKWWVLCALVEDCIAPTGDILCRGGFQNQPTKYAGCHRYDQSAINILLANKFRFHQVFAKHFDDLEVIRRHNILGESPRLCTDQ